MAAGATCSNANNDDSGRTRRSVVTGVFDYRALEWKLVFVLRVVRSPMRARAGRCVHWKDGPHNARTRSRNGARLIPPLVLTLRVAHASRRGADMRLAL